MKDILFFIFGTLGLTNIVVESSIFKPVRDFVSKRSKILSDLTSCHTCTGFWVGVVVHFLLFHELTIFVLVGGFCGSAFGSIYKKF